MSLHFLLFMQHRQLLVTKRLRAALADIETIVSIVKFAHGKVQIADPTTCSIWLTGDLAIIREQFVERKHHLLEVERSRWGTALYAQRPQCG